MEATMPPTHEVFNQVPPLTGNDVADDPAMLDALQNP
jgi:putative acyl-CoA dehydrogenase